MIVLEQGMLQLIQPIITFTKKPPVHLALIALTAVCETKQRAILILAAQDQTKAVGHPVLERHQRATIQRVVLVVAVVQQRATLIPTALTLR